IRAVSANPADTVIVGAPDPVTGSNGPAAIRGYKGPCYGGSSYLIGFTITNGYTFATGGTAYLDQYGGGAWGGVLSNCVIVGNMAKDTGGGRAYGPTYNSIIRNNTASGGGGVGNANCWNCVISNNTATGSGGGLYNACQAYNCQIVNNMAGAGGALSSACIASNCVIRGNTAVTGWGGAAGYSQGTTYKFYNCLIVENQAPSVGAIYVRAQVAGNMGTLVNCTVVSNRATTAGACAGNYGIFAITNCIIRFNYNTASGVESNYNFTTNSSVAYSLTAPAVTGQAYDGGNNLSGDPGFVGNGDFRLRSDSVCLDAGTNLPAVTPDLDGRTRPLDGHGDGFAIHDLGAYERPAERGILFVFE
ncbi:MAG: hypothetical protein PHW60_04290, partial [Kiritimatiellae bacterium]|nr:hypothetical protein [Kiritimatiellia bacterium]